MAALATKHDKVSLIGPPLAQWVGLELREAEVDTDLLGTFTGEVPRQGSPHEVVLAKARLGMAASGLPLGVASEGSFGPLDAMPLLVADTELVAFVDDELGIELVESAVGFGLPVLHVEIAPGEASTLPLDTAGFPDHGLIVRPVGTMSQLTKGIHDPADLHRAIAACAAASPVGRVVVESDLRAMHHPSRRRVIARAAERLAIRLAATCPACDAPGWGVVRREAGAPCAVCGSPTRIARLEVHACLRCAHESSLPTMDAAGTDPEHCPTCNP